MINCPDFREQKYNEIKISFKTGYGNIKTRRYIYDSETGNILFRTVEGKDGWIPLKNLLAYASWPIARSGRWPDPFKDFDFKILSETELKTIYDNTIYLEEA